jgi:hypothetical protein
VNVRGFQRGEFVSVVGFGRKAGDPIADRIHEVLKEGGSLRDSEIYRNIFEGNAHGCSQIRLTEAASAE